MDVVVFVREDFVDLVTRDDEEIRRECAVREIREVGDRYVVPARQSQVRRFDECPCELGPELLRSELAFRALVDIHSIPGGPRREDHFELAFGGVRDRQVCAVLALDRQPTLLHLGAASLDQCQAFVMPRVGARRRSSAAQGIDTKRSAGRRHAS